MRSKSMDNFFQRSNAESRLPTAIITSPPPPPSPPPLSESPPAYECSLPRSTSVSPNLSLSSHSPSLSPSLSATSKTLSQAQPTQPVKTHCFQEHVFRRPTTCQTCKHVIQGTTITQEKQWKKFNSHTIGDTDQVYLCVSANWRLWKGYVLYLILGYIHRELEAGFAL